MGMMHTRFPMPTDDELGPVVAELEEVWTREDHPQPEQWPVELAARICPVFRFLTGRAVG